MEGISDTVDLSQFAVKRFLMCLRVPPASGRRHHPGPVSSQRLCEERSGFASSRRPAPLPSHSPTSQEPSVRHHPVRRVPERAGRHRPGAQHRTGLFRRGVNENRPRTLLLTHPGSRHCCKHIQGDARRGPQQKTDKKYKHKTCTYITH